MALESKPINPPAPDASLVASAHVARALALEHCTHAVDGDCTWYHGVWQYLRALGVIKNAGGQADFLRDMLQSLALKDGARRVLISGAADDAMTLIALGAFRTIQIPVELTVIDFCEAPLALSRWSAASAAGVTLSTQRVDVLELVSERPYDVILTTGFLSYFEPALRPRLFRQWASLLRPGGSLLFTNRLRPGTAGLPLGFTPGQVRTFCAAVRERGEQHQAMLGLAPALLEGWACEYAARFKAFPVGSADDVLALLVGAGFAPNRLDTAPFPGISGGPTITGPTMGDRVDYIRVLATRR